jgi:membrane-associated phospholipid phosphatase
MVVSAEFGAFGPLSIIQSRPPWALERPAVLPDRGVHGVGLLAVERFSIQANTFPSGHAAGSLAVALAVLAAMPWSGAVFLVLAVSISLACVVGRYHYVVDVLAGAALAMLIWLVN